ncbi:hypothetical protein DRN77_02870 [Methanosarcinales archaeon]|nr:MAG: hypothetical protein DRN77_02870 [Methanosarcinales archaeon]
MAQSIDCHSQSSSFDSAFKNVDVLIAPTMPTPAFGIGELADPLSQYLAIFQVGRSFKRSHLHCFFPYRFS